MLGLKLNHVSKRGHRNTQGLVTYTLGNPDFIDIVNHHDNLMLCESWTTEYSKLDITDYECVAAHRKSTKRAK